MFFHR